MPTPSSSSLGRPCSKRCRPSSWRFRDETKQSLEKPRW
jgi:hypothetical protein